MMMAHLFICCAGRRRMNLFDVLEGNRTIYFLLADTFSRYGKKHLFLFGNRSFMIDRDL